MYLWRKPPTSIGLDNNMHKEKRLTIEDSGLPYLGGEKLSSYCCFEANIMAIWQYDNS